jgi:hypothetical protein
MSGEDEIEWGEGYWSDELWQQHVARMEVLIRNREDYDAAKRCIDDFRTALAERREPPTMKDPTFRWFDGNLLGILERYGYDTLDDIEDATDEELLAIRQVDKKRVKKIRSFLRRVPKTQKV